MMQQTLGAVSDLDPSTSPLDLVTLVLTVPASDLSAALAGQDGGASVQGFSVATAEATGPVAPTSVALVTGAIKAVSPDAQDAPASFSSFSRDSALPSNVKGLNTPATRTFTYAEPVATSATPDASTSPANPSSSHDPASSAALLRSQVVAATQSSENEPASSSSRSASSSASRAVTTIKVAAIPSIAIKPVVSGQTTDPSATDTMVVYVPAPTSSSGNGDGNSDFLHSLGTSPVNIALTALVCTGIAVLLIAAVAFFLRRCRRRANRRRRAQTRVSAIHIDQSHNRYSDCGSLYDDDAQPIMQQVTASSARSNAGSFYGHAPHQVPYMAEQSGQLRPGYQFGTATVHNLIDTENEKIRDGQDWNNEMLQVRRRSEMDLSLVQHLQASQPFATPSIMHSETSQIFNYAPTVASSPDLERNLSLQQQLRSTYIGPFSTSIPASALPVATSTRMNPTGSTQRRLLQVPARPNRPASLTSSFTHAVERDLAENPFATPDCISSPAQAASNSTWGARAFSSVVNATNGAITTLLSPVPTSPNYDEEKADRFTALPDPASARRPSVRWGSVTSMSSNAPDRRVYQQMASRFSVTTLGTALTNSPTQSVETASAYDYQIQSASVAPRRAAPVLIAQREATPPGSDDDQLSSDSSTLTDQVDNTPTSVQGPWASTEPLKTSAVSKRPDIGRLDSVRSSETVRSSIFDSADPEADGYEMTEEEQREMRDLIRKRRAAALAAK